MPQINPLLIGKRRDFRVLRRLRRRQTTPTLRHSRRDSVRPMMRRMRPNAPRYGEWVSYVTRGRKAARLSVSALARLLGVDRRTVQRWEKGEQRPEQADLVVRLAAAFGDDPERALTAAGMRPGAPPLPPLGPYEEAFRRLLARLEDPDTHPRERAMIQRYLDGLGDLDALTG